MRAVAIALDGVLRKPADVHALDMSGKLLYASLREHARIVILGSYSLAADRQFLDINGFTDYASIDRLSRKDGQTERERKVEQIHRLRRDGFNFEFVVTPDPVFVRDLYAMDVTGLLYLHPEYTAGAHRPDVGGLKAWKDLEADVDYRRQAAADERKVTQ